MENISIRKSFVDRVRSFASVHELFVKGGKYIVALSGGADSVSLLLVMKYLSKSLGIAVEAAHCNFHLRGEESKRDEQFCVALCARLGIRLHLIHFATKDYAEVHHVSIEMAARDLRYKYFEDLRHDIVATGICVAHHRDDSVETVLLNLVRGTGVRGLRGIQPRNGRVIRPMLCVSRKDIVDFLAHEEQDFVTDSSNLVNDVKRNKIRLDIIPMLERLNPNVLQAIFETSLNMNEAFKVYDDAMEKSVEAVCENGRCDFSRPVYVSVECLFRQPSAESTLFNILKSCHFTSQQTAQVYRMLAGNLMQISNKNMHFAVIQGKTITSSTHELLFDRGRIVLQPKGFGTYSRMMRIPETGIYVYSGDRRLSVTEEYIDTGYTVSRERMCATVDADKVKFPLVIRPLATGERFIPFGMAKSKLVSDFLTDRKRTLFDKRRQLVVADAGGNIVWLVGEMIDNRVRITAESKKSLRIKFE